ncbi:MAG: Glutamate racemase (EC [uncultured Sulfurovum sp.]|uniref:Glutamate racemase n=1 Tax=uncultured Sulfurovum sp. TaxID=269237 RepID=A0A6S6TTQ1_9BACT|nr:MAG: Glutamate racemase (EC [uncultured Sulfurovum sp.]
MKSKKLKVGIFDSGLGGLTVLSSLQKVLKGAEVFYIADTKNAPYGGKTFQQILQYSLDITQYFITHHQIDALIIACNTATSAAIKILREKYSELIILGTEPGVKPAIKQTKTGNIGVLATPATLRGEKYQQLVDSFTHGETICLHEQACPGLVEQIEKGEVHSLETREMLTSWLEPMKQNNVDTIVLGCTHYPLVSELIKRIMQRDINLIETGDAIARHLLTCAKSKGHNNSGDLTLNLYATQSVNVDVVKTLFVNDYKMSTITI